MFELVRKITRPSPDIEFFSIRTCKDIPPEALDYFAETYKNTGKRISDARTLSDDRLTETVVEIWDSRESYLEYLCDAYIDDNITAHAKEYVRKHGIKYETLSAKEI